MVRTSFNNDSLALAPQHTVFSAWQHLNAKRGGAATLEYPSTLAITVSTQAPPAPSPALAAVVAALMGGATPAAAAAAAVAKADGSVHAAGNTRGIAAPAGEGNKRVPANAAKDGNAGAAKAGGRDEITPAGADALVTVTPASRPAGHRANTPHGLRASVRKVMAAVRLGGAAGGVPLASLTRPVTEPCKVRIERGHTRMTSASRFVVLLTAQLRLLVCNCATSPIGCSPFKGASDQHEQPLPFNTGAVLNCSDASSCPQTPNAPLYQLATGAGGCSALALSHSGEMLALAVSAAE